MEDPPQGLHFILFFKISNVNRSEHLQNCTSFRVFPVCSGQYLSKVVHGKNSGEPVTGRLMHMRSEGSPVWSGLTDKLL